LFTFTGFKKLVILAKDCVVPEKIHTHPMEGYWEFQGGGGAAGQKSQNVRSIKHEAKLEFLAGEGGAKHNKKPSMKGL